MPAKKKQTDREFTCIVGINLSDGKRYESGDTFKESEATPSDIKELLAMNAIMENDGDS